MKTIAIIQARLGSSRFPGKVLEKLGNDTVLGHCIERAKKIKGIDRLVVATGDPSRNFLIQKEANNHDVPCFTHDDEDDVLGRFLMCAEHYMVHYVLRICADAPLFEPEICNKQIKEMWEYNASHDHLVDYVAYYKKGDSLPCQALYPNGNYKDLILTRALFSIYYSEITDHDREHVTPYIYNHPQLFKIHKIPIIDLQYNGPDINTRGDLEKAKQYVKSLV